MVKEEGPGAEDPVRESRRITARVIMDLALSSPARVDLGGGIVPISGLLGDPQVVGPLLKIGLFAIGAQSFSDMRLQGHGGRTEPDPMPGVPTGLIALAFLYGLRACGETPTKRHIRREAARIERAFGRVPLDTMLMSEIATLAAQEGGRDGQG